MTDEVERLREALSLIASHARADERERGFGEASRYYGIAEEALREGALDAHVQAVLAGGAANSAATLRIAIESVMPLLERAPASRQSATAMRILEAALRGQVNQ